MQRDRLTLAVIASLILIITALRWFDPICCITATRPPNIINVFIVLIALGLLTTVFQRSSFQKGIVGVTVGLIVILILLKNHARDRTYQ